MADYGSVGGLLPLGGSYSRPGHEMERRLADREPGGEPDGEPFEAPQDTAHLAGGAEVAVELVRQRVRAVTLECLRAQGHEGADPAHRSFPQAAVQDPEPGRLALALLAEQRWLCAGHEVADVLLQQARRQGLQQAEDVLAAVAQEDAALALWFTQLRRAVG